MFTHAGHCRLCREEQGFFTKRIIGSLLRNQFKLCLCIRKILALVIKLSQLHSNFRSEQHGTSPFAAEVRMKLAELYYQRQDFANAQTQFELIAQQTPDNSLGEDRKSVV